MGAETLCRHNPEPGLKGITALTSRSACPFLSVFVLRSYFGALQGHNSILQYNRGWSLPAVLPRGLAYRQWFHRRTTFSVENFHKNESVIAFSFDDAAHATLYMGSEVLQDRS